LAVNLRALIIDDDRVFLGRSRKQFLFQLLVLSLEVFGAQIVFIFDRNLLVVSQLVE
jgi:hypothetical protein